MFTGSFCEDKKQKRAILNSTGLSKSAPPNKFEGATQFYFEQTIVLMNLG